VDHRWIEANPARIPLALGRDPHGHPPHLILDPAELLAVWAVQRRFSPLADVTLVLGLTGLRGGEFVALRPSDLLATTTGGPMVHIARSIVRARGDGDATVKSTKSGADRLVPLAHLAADIAQTWANGKDPDALLVPGPDGRCGRRPSAGRLLDPAFTTCGTAAPRICSPILGVQGILGHASPDTTLRYYGTPHRRRAPARRHEPLRRSP